jgi:hypothetical protein
MTKTIESLIINIRGRNVILDADLAGLYGIPTGRLNEQVKRNADRFPPDFMFQLSRVEWQELKTTPKPSSTQSVELHYDNANPPQIATGSQKHRDPRFLPRVFTEHGALLAANVLNSPPAVKMSVFIVRAFIKQREQLATNTTITLEIPRIAK